MGGRRVQQAVVCASAVGLVIALSAAAQGPRNTGDTPFAEELADSGLPPQVLTDLVRVTAGLEVRRERVVPGAHAPIHLRFFLKPGWPAQSDRIVATTITALERLTAWYGPYPFERLTVVDAPWRSALNVAVYPGVMVVSSRWLAPVGDLSLERAVIAAVARLYWIGVAAREVTWLEDGLALYSGTRAIHEELVVRHFATPRYFGGFVPFTIQTILLSPTPTDPRPRVRGFADLESRVPLERPATPEVAQDDAAASGAEPDHEVRAGGQQRLFAGDEARRAALALHTLERYIGWPALQQTLRTFRARAGQGRATAADLASVASEQRGSDLSWFFDEAFRFSARFDYGVAGFSSVPVEGVADSYETVVSLRRYGDAVFAGTSQTGSEAFGGGRALPVAVSFADGTTVRDWWDGRRPEVQLDYVSTSPAISVSVDPDAMLLLDSDRTNNSRTLEPDVHVTGVRMVMHWLVWLQDLMLTRTALV